MGKQLRVLGALLLGVLISACGGGGDAPAPEPVSATVGRAGGSLEATSAQGGTLNLTLPADAVAQDTALTIAGLAAEDGVIDRFSVQPGGLLLLTKGTLRYTGAQTLPDRAVLRWRAGERRIALPTIRQGNTLTAATGYLGYGPSVAAGLGAAGQQRRAALSAGGARPLADAAPDEAEIEVATLDCDAEQARLPFLIASAASVGDEAQAMALFDELQAVVQTCQNLQTAELAQRACDAYQGAELLARTTAADSYEKLKGLVVKLMIAQAEVQLMGGACNAMPVDQVLELKFAQFSSFLLAEYAKPSFANVEYERARLELRDLYEHLAACEHMGAAGACQGMRNTLFPTLFDRLREGAYRACRVQDDAVPLALMFAENLVFSRQDRPLRDPASRVGPYLDLGRFTYADLETDIAHCRSAVTVTTFEEADPPIQAAETELSGGADPGSPPAPLAVSVPRDGSITFGGDVRALTCPDGSIGIDRVVARVGGVEIDSRVINGRRFTLDTQPFDFAVPTTMTRALLDPLRDGGFTIDVFREGDACQGGFSRSFKLYSVVVSLPEIGLSVTPQASILMPGGTVQFSARVTGIASTDVQWSASAGSISSTGLFTAPTTSGPVTVQAAIVANPSIAALATVTVGALPLNWVGTITFTHNESFDSSTQEGVLPMGDITQVSRSVVESYRRTTTITLPVEFALRATDGTPAVVTVGAPSGSDSAISSREGRVDYFHTNLPGCIISRHAGTDTRHAVNSGFTGSGMVIDIRVTGDGQYSVDAVGTIAGRGQMTSREFRFTSYSPQDCGLVAGDFDQTTVTEAGGGLTDELPLQRGAITNGQIKGSASQTEGDRTVTMTWEFLPR